MMKRNSDHSDHRGWLRRRGILIATVGATAALLATVLSTATPAQTTTTTAAPTTTTTAAPTTVQLDAPRGDLWETSLNDFGTIGTISVRFTTPRLHRWSCAWGTPEPTHPNSPDRPTDENGVERDNCWNRGNSTQEQLDATNIDEGPLKSMQSRYRRSGATSWTTGRSYDFAFDDSSWVEFYASCTDTACDGLSSASGTKYDVQIRVNSQTIAGLTSAGTGAWTTSEVAELPS